MGRLQCKTAAYSDYTPGKWTMDFAKDIGRDLVVDVIKKGMSMP
jgi:hypothetical protein